MSDAMSNYLEDKIATHIFQDTAFSQPAKIYVALTKHVSNDTMTGSTIDEVDGSGYARKLVCTPGTNCDAAFDDPAGAGDTENTGAITFDTATGDWGPVSGVAIIDASSAGNLLMYGNLTTPRNVLNGDIFQFNAGDLDISIK